MVDRDRDHDDILVEAVRMVRSHLESLDVDMASITGDLVRATATDESRSTLAAQCRAAARALDELARHIPTPEGRERSDGSQAPVQ